MHHARAFTLIEVVVVLLVFSVIAAMAAVITRGVTAAQKRSLTATRIALVDTALVQFVAQQRRLPCPARGNRASTHADAGTEEAADRNAGGCTTNMQHGVVPWRTLGLTEADATDGWDRRLTYRIQPGLAADGAMNMSMCDPAGSEGGATPRACNTACTSTALASCTPPSHFLNGRGLQIQNLAGTVLANPSPGVNLPHTGAAYVVISHGETGGGAYLYSGVAMTSTVTDGTEEAKNYATAAYTAGVTHYIDDTVNDASGATHFDDVVSRPTVLSVVNKAGLGPRTH